MNKIFILLMILIFPQEISAQKSVKFQGGVEIGGITQCIEITGKDDTKQILLFLHGGPGFSSRRYARKFIKNIDKDFIVAQWDQRESGNTAHWSPFKDSITLEMLHTDTYEVVQYLLKKFNRDKIYLVGYSWGGFLGLHFANAYPELLHAYVSVSGIINGEESERLTLQVLKAKASSSKNGNALNEIGRIKLPFEEWESLYYQRKWAAYFSGVEVNEKSFPRSLFQNWSHTWLPVFQEALKVNYFEDAPEINCPIYFFVSSKDLVSNFTVAEQYYQSVKADQKYLVWFDISTHEIPTQEPKKFSEELVKIGLVDQD